MMGPNGVYFPKFLEKLIGFSLKFCTCKANKNKVPRAGEYDEKQHTF